ncbi:NHL repeat containing protein [Thecamonas trahens ATCC 50062]|uniref:NHL repeat containing protein n=1 Tax=Thecamonas trahens ATCC 50062 TaxID=461836 RepID=A0A0L0D4K2_THETB|nr:NHL repeat containing protein [Thecamonas trahens ATCC 50062]KNC47287.1 NHL repeat containing protein [Thecamonas trahens ATCC 50062]|eukprot:XP_013759628.1 NHL repeat containing protein [Thecamonas trahens ATCC 50062]
MAQAAFRTTCAGCGAPYRDPRLLPCLHTACASCAASGPCPVCTAALPPGAAAGDLPRNLLVANVLTRAALAAGPASPTPPPCAVCCPPPPLTGPDRAKPPLAAPPPSAAASYACSQCAYLLCETHARAHAAAAATGRHTLAVLHSDDLPPVHAPALCGRHQPSDADNAPPLPRSAAGPLPLELYCYSCSELVCSLCVVGAHRGCDVRPVDEAAGDTASALVGLRGELFALANAFSACADTATAAQDRLTASAGQAVTAIDLAFDAVFEALVARKSALIRELESQRAARASTLAAAHHDAMQSHARAASAAAFLGLALEQANPPELLALAPSMTARADTLLATEAAVDVGTSADTQFTLALDPTPAVTAIASLGALLPPTSAPQAAAQLAAHPREPHEPSFRSPSHRVAPSPASSSAPHAPLSHAGPTTLVPDGQSPGRRRIDVVRPRKVWGKYGRALGQFRAPAGIACDAVTGNLVLADKDNSRLVVLDPYGVFLGTVDGGGALRAPTGVALDQSRYYVSDSGCHCVWVLSRESGDVEHVWGSPGSGNGELASPQGVLLLPDGSGTLAIADSGNARIQLFDSSGLFSHKISGLAVSGTELRRPFGLAWLGAGDAEAASGAATPALLVSDLAGGRILAFNMDGTAHALHAQLAGLDLVSPAGLGLLGQRYLLVADYTSHCVVACELASGKSVRFGGHGTAPGLFVNPIDLVVGGRHAAAVVVVDHSNARLQALDLHSALHSVLG